MTIIYIPLNINIGVKEHKVNATLDPKLSKNSCGGAGSFLSGQLISLLMPIAGGDVYHKEMKEPIRNNVSSLWV